MRVGFVGAGKIGQGVAGLAVAAGHSVILSNSRGPETLAELASSLGGTAGTVSDAVGDSDLVILTVPFPRTFDIDPAPFTGKIVMDTGNYYPDRDGRIPELDTFQITTSEMVQRHLPGANVVKAFNAIMYVDLVPPFALPGARRALPVAGDEENAVAQVIDFHHSIGLDALPIGPLSESWRFERAKPAYCVPLDLEGLREKIDAAEREVELPHGSWWRGAKLAGRETAPPTGAAL